MLYIWKYSIMPIKLLSILFSKMSNISDNLSILYFFSGDPTPKPFVLLFQCNQLFLGLLSVSAWFCNIHHQCGTEFYHSTILDTLCNKTHYFPLSCFMPLFYCSSPLITSCERVFKRSIFPSFLSLLQSLHLLKVLFSLMFDLEFG